jgi:uncharacterized membrane protein
MLLKRPDGFHRDDCTFTFVLLLTLAVWKRPNFLSEITYGPYIITLFTESKERMPIVKSMSVRLYVVIQEPLGGFE